MTPAALPDPGVIAVALASFDAALPLVSPDRGTVVALREAGREAEHADLAYLPDGSAFALVLAADELSAAGDHAEGLIEDAARVLEPGRSLLVSARNPLRGAPGEPGRGFTSAQVRAALEHRGCMVDLLAAPGAGAAVTGAPAGAGPAYDPALDRRPGLLDAGTRVVAVARTPATSVERSERFFATLPRKVVASGVLCREPGGKLLVVHDAFRGHWTIPGGVVDADEDPRTGAARETWEEAGVRVEVGALLGLFASSWPDRLVLLYAAVPRQGSAAPRPVQAHEIDAAAWVPLDDALRQVAPPVRWQLERCLEQPGGTWRQ